jgi:hypothetical protein
VTARRDTFKPLIPKELKQIAAELVASRLGDDDNLSARNPPVFGRVDTGKNLKLLDGLDTGTIAWTVNRFIVIVHPVQCEVVPGLFGAGYVKTAAIAQR